MIEHGCKFLKKLPAERAIIEAELEGLEGGRGNGKSLLTGVRPARRNPL